MEQLPAEDDAAVIVIGAGAVGLALAIRLARAGTRVLVLEAGPSTPPADFERHNQGRSVAREHRGIASGRMRALGGTTRLWGGQLVPFGEQDFDGPTVDGPSPWPIRYAEMAPAIADAFRFLGIDAAGTDRETIWRRATDLPIELGDKLRLGMNIWLPQPDFARLFAADLAKLETLTVRTGHPVTRLLFDATGRVAAVEATRADGSIVRFAAPRIVLAAGTFENIRLLLRTAATEPRCGFAGNRHIGQGYIDHLHGLAGRIHIKDARRVSELFDNIYFDKRKHSVKVRAADAFRSDARISNCAGTINTPSSVGTIVRDLAGMARRIVGKPGAASLGALVGQAFTLSRILLPLAVRYVVSRRSTSLLFLGVSLGLELEQIVTPKSYVYLDPAAPPETAACCLHWELDGREIEAAAAFCEAIAAAFEQAGLGMIELDPRITARDPAFLASCHDSNHQMGGTRMAERADDGVVDRDLRVFGTDNLHVLGASVFPTGSFANPTLTALAFAMRLADHLEAALPAERSAAA